MMAAIDGLATRASASPLGQACARLGDLIDCVIPIVLASVLVIGTLSIAFGLIN